MDQRSSQTPAPRLARLSGAALALLMGLTACGSGVNPNEIAASTVQNNNPVGPQSVLTQADVDAIVKAAAASVNVPLTIAVSDRRGQVLAVYTNADGPMTAISNFGVSKPADDVAVGLARTAAYFSNDQAPIGSRTVRYLSGIHFPPGIMQHRIRPALRHRKHQPRLPLQRLLPSRTEPADTYVHTHLSPWNRHRHRYRQSQPLRLRPERRQPRRGAHLQK